MILRYRLVNGEMSQILCVICELLYVTTKCMYSYLYVFMSSVFCLKDFHQIYHLRYRVLSISSIKCQEKCSVGALVFHRNRKTDRFSAVDDKSNSFSLHLIFGLSWKRPLNKRDITEQSSLSVGCVIPIVTIVR
jgi:hypothetical protein